MKASHHSDNQTTAENVQEAGRGSPLPRLVRLLWWAAITIIWTFYIVLLAAPFAAVLWLAEKYCDWAEGSNWVLRIKYWIEDHVPDDEPNVEHIHPLPAGAEVDHGVEVQATENHGKETAGRGLDGAAC